MVENRTLKREVKELEDQLKLLKIQCVEQESTVTSLSQQLEDEREKGTREITILQKEIDELTSQLNVTDPSDRNLLRQILKGS